VTRRRASGRYAWAVLLLGALACGKQGDPLPPIRVVPQPVGELDLSQRGERLVLNFVAPRAATDGSRLGLLDIEILRADREGDFEKVAVRRRVRAAPGEILAEAEPLPPVSTKLRVAARAVAKGRASNLSPILTLEVQQPPPAPSGLRAELSPGGVVLEWNDPNPVPPGPPAQAAPAAPAAEPAPPGSPASPSAPPTATATPAPAPTPTATPTPPPTAAPTPAPTPTPTPSPAAPASGAAAATPTSAPSPTPAATSSATPKPPLRGFWIYRRAKDGVYSRPLRADPIAGVLFEDNTAQPGEEWCYVVRNVASADPVVESDDSPERCLAVKDVAPPAAPTGLAIVRRADGLELSWSPAPEPDLAGYHVYRAAAEQEPERIAVVPPGETLFRDASASAGQLYTYSVTAVDAAGNESARSAPIQARP
jgi:hypothetical protein